MRGPQERAFSEELWEQRMMGAAGKPVRWERCLCRLDKTQVLSKWGCWNQGERTRPRELLAGTGTGCFQCFKRHKFEIRDTSLRLETQV